MHVELAPRRREAVTIPGRGRGAAEGGGEVCPGPGGRIVHVQVVEVACGAGLLARGAYSCVRVKYSDLKQNHRQCTLTGQ